MRLGWCGQVLGGAALLVGSLTAGAIATPGTAGAATGPMTCSHSGMTETCTFAYTGAEQPFVVPAGVTSMTATAIGAAGGAGQTRSSGGKGATVSGTLDTTGVHELYVEVGGTGATGGWNGGAPGRDDGGDGGGASDVRTTSRSTATSSLASRLLVAGGGGGGGGGTGGGAGGTAGAAGSSGTSFAEAPCVAGGGGAGGAGTTAAGGSAGAGGTATGAVSPGDNGVNGSLGTGGAGGTYFHGGGGGGGGYYGGGGGGGGAFIETAECTPGFAQGGGGGGGSSYATGAEVPAPTHTTATASVTLTWTGTLPAPTAISTSTYTTTATTTLSVPAPGLVANGLSYGAVLMLGTGPSNGSATISSDGAFTYTPDPGYTGTDEFTYTETNGIGTKSTGTVNITVDKAPAFTSADSATFTVGTPGTFTVTASGYPNGTTMHFGESGSLPTGVTLASTGTLSGTPAPGTEGTYDLVLTATNGVIPEATQDFTLTVEAPAPTLRTDLVAPTPPSGALSHASCSATAGAVCHASNDSVTVTASPGPGALTISEYAADPVGTTTFTSTGEYFDVQVASGSAFGTLTIRDCNLSGGTKLYWWNQTTGRWEAVTPVSGPTGTPACLTATLSSTSSPTIGELVGTVFAVGTPAAPSSTTTTTRVAGTTADATAAAELERTFPWTKGTCPTSRAAVVATTAEYNDALASQFLAQSLTTGTLLTPTETLSPVTATTLQDEGITTVYVVGGPLAITTTVLKAIEALTADACGGKTPTGKITVDRLSGTTQYGTAEAIAEHVGAAASLAFPGAYATTNAASGTGRFNDTAGIGSGAPSGAVPTAIVASGVEFQDAQAASVVSYRTKLPLLLTPATTLSTTTVAAIEKLGIEQVILMGGTLAITNTVEATLIAKTGVAVLRVAGGDYTDTAVELARFEAGAKTTGLNWTPGHKVLVARGNGFTDGIAGAVLDSPLNTATGAKGTARPLLLTETPTVVGTFLSSFLTTTGAKGIDGTPAKTLAGFTVLGGPLALTTAVVTQMETDLKG